MPIPLLPTVPCLLLAVLFAYGAIRFADKADLAENTPRYPAMARATIGCLVGFFIAFVVAVCPVAALMVPHLT